MEVFEQESSKFRSWHQDNDSREFTKPGRGMTTFSASGRLRAADLGDHFEEHL